MSDEKKPLRFGPDLDDSELAGILAEEEEIKPFYDPSSIPGHAEQVMANEIASSEKLSTDIKEGYYRRFGTGPRDLEADFAWVRDRGPGGETSYNANVDRMAFSRRGYRQATVEDLKRLGFGIPPAAHVEADGSIRREDTSLYIVDGERARRNEEEKLRQAQEAEAPEDMVGEQQGADIWRVEEERDTRSIKH